MKDWDIEKCRQVIQDCMDEVSRSDRSSQHDASLWNTIRNTRALLESLMDDIAKCQAERLDALIQRQQDLPTDMSTN